MSKKVIIAALISVSVIVGLIVWQIGSQSDTESTNGDTSNQDSNSGSGGSDQDDTGQTQGSDTDGGGTDNGTNSSGGNSGQSSGFKPQATQEQDFSVKITGKLGDSDVSLNLKYDASGVYSVASTAETGEAYTSYFLEDITVVCIEGSCYGYEDAADTFTFNPEDLIYSSDEISQFDQAAETLGDESCTIGTCKVWQLIEGGTTNKIYVNAANNQIVELRQKSDTADVRAIYTYGDQNINVPEYTKTETPG